MSKSNKKGSLALTRIHANTMNHNKISQAHLLKEANGNEGESPFDNVLRTDDLQRAQRLVSIPDFLHDYPPKMSLDEFIAGKVENDGFSATLCLLIRSGVYSVTANFLMHVLEHFSDQNILEVLNSMKYDYSGSPKKVMHYALRRATRSSVTEAVSLQIIQKLLDLGFDLNSLDEMNQSAIFYFVQGKCSNSHHLRYAFHLSKQLNKVQPAITHELIYNIFPPKNIYLYTGEDACWNPLAITGMSDTCASNEEINSLFRIKYYKEYKFQPQIWDFLVHVKKVKLNLVDKFQDTPLSLAVKLHRKEIMSKLITEPRFVEIGLVTGDQPPFHLYCEEGILCPEVFFHFFLRLHIIKAGLLVPNFEGKTVLHCLLNNPLGHVDPMALIMYIKKFRELKEIDRIFISKDKLGHTPLMTAICHSYPYDILKLLIPAKDVHKRLLSLPDNNGFNALALALTRYKGGFSQCNPRTLHSAPYSSYPRPHDIVCNTGAPALNGTLNNNNNSRQNSNTTEPIDGEVALHTIIQDLASLGLKLDQDVRVSNNFPDESILTDDATTDDTEVACGTVHCKSIAATQSVLSVIMTNTHLSHRTINLLVRKDLFKPRFHDIVECIARFRLDILYELMRKVSTSESLFDQIASHQSIAIEILTHLYTHRHRYFAANSSNSAPRMRSSTNGTIGMVTNNGHLIASSQTIPGDNDLSPVTQELALENLKRVAPLLRLCFDHFGHDVNFTIMEDCSTSHQGTVKHATLHALIQANSWLPLQSVVDYLLVEKGHLIDTEIYVKGCGTPLNHAIRTGQYDIADKLLDLDADCSKVDLKITVVPLKRGFSNTIKRMIERGARLPPEFAQKIKSITNDSAIESEYNHLMSGSS